MPANSLNDAELSCGRTNVMSHELLSQVRPAAPIYWTSKHPTVWRLIRRLAMPFTQRLDQVLVDRNRFLRTLRLTDADHILHD